MHQTSAALLPLTGHRIQYLAIGHSKLETKEYTVNHNCIYIFNILHYKLWPIMATIRYIKLKNTNKEIIATVVFSDRFYSLQWK